MKKYLIHTVLWSALLFASSCVEQTGSNHNAVNIDFKVDPLLLDDTVIVSQEYGYYLSPPAGWEPVPEYMRGDVAYEYFALLSTDTLTRSKTLDIYADPTADAMLFIASLDFLADTSRTNTRRIAYDKYIKEKYAERLTAAQLLANKNLSLYQYIIEVKKMRLVRFLLQSSNGELLQFDYFSPSARFDSLRSAIEASVGTIYLDLRR